VTWPNSQPFAILSGQQTTESSTKVPAVGVSLYPRRGLFSATRFPQVVPLMAPPLILMFSRKEPGEM
jgi:hypothetical protein